MSDIKEQILDHYHNGDLAGMEDLISLSLKAQGADLYPVLFELMPEVDQKLKGTIFEKLTEQQDKALIQPLAEVIAEERNPFLVRQELSAIIQVEFPETIDALEALESKLSSDAQRLCQRSLAKLRAKFREHFYIKEFQKGSSSHKRMKTAADAMLKNPHPAYVDFLNQALQTKDAEMRIEAARVLHELGNAESLQAMFDHIEVDLKQRSLTLLYSQMPGFGKEQLVGQALAKWFAEQKAVAWEQQEEGGWAVVKDWPAGDIADFVLAAFDLKKGNVYKLNHMILKTLFDGDSITNSDLKKALQMVKTRLERQTETIERMLLAMGAIAWRIKDEHFTTRLESMLQADDPEHDTWMIAALAGSGDPKAQEKLLAFLRDDSKPEKTRHVLEALSHLELDEVPESILNIAADAERGKLRALAIDLVARSKKRATLLKQLLDKPQLVVKADVVKVIAEQGIEELHDQLLDMLETPPNDSLLLVIIDALEHFNKETTGVTVQRFIMPPRSQKIRLAALRTVFLASEDRGLALVIEALERYPEAKMPLAATEFTTLIKQHFPFEEKEASFLEQREFWQKLINHPDNGLRARAVQLIESCNFDRENATAWSQMLTAAQTQQTAARSFAEIETLRSAHGRAQKILEQLQKQRELTDQMDQILRKLNGSVHYEKIQGLRELAQNYRPQMLAGDAIRSRELVKHLSALLKDHDDNFKTETLVLEAAGKVQHPLMLGLIQPYVEHKNWAVSKAAKKAIENGVDESFKKDMIRKILAVDDSSFITQLVQRALSKRPYQVEAENNALHALERLQKETFDLLLLDLKMPELMGPDFLRQAREADCWPAFVLILTGNRNREDLMEVMSLGVDGIILKPFQAKDILNRIDDLIAKACGEAEPT